MTLMVQLSDKDFKAAILSLFQWTIMKILEEMKTYSLTKETESLRKEREYIKKSQKNIAQ